MSLEKGRVAEEHAKSYLIEQGLTWVASQYRSRFGEIDLVMRQGKMLIFVEVKSRASHGFASAFESVTKSKQQKLWVTALHYLSQHRLHHCNTRFDVLALQGMPPQVTWIQDAFRRGI